MDLSMVIPVKEESENLPELLKEIVAAMEPTGFTYEVIAIDDGSRDNTWEVLENLSHEYPFLKGFRFQFNCGKADALAFGFSKATGRYVATLDGATISSRAGRSAGLTRGTRRFLRSFST